MDHGQLQCLSVIHTLAEETRLRLSLSCTLGPSLDIRDSSHEFVFVVHWGQQTNKRKHGDFVAAFLFNILIILPFETEERESSRQKQSVPRDQLRDANYT